MAINPLQLGMSIANSATTGLARGRERAFDELKAMEAGYNRAAKEMDARIKAEQAVFEYQVLKPLELAIKQTELEYSRNRLRMQRESELASLAAMQREQDIAHNQIQSAASFNSIFAGISNNRSELQRAEADNNAELDRLREYLKLATMASEQNAPLPKFTFGDGVFQIKPGRKLDYKHVIEKLQTEIQQREAKMPELQQEKEKLRELESAMGTALYSRQKELNRLLSTPLGSSRDVAAMRMQAAQQLNLLQSTLDNLAITHPIAFEAYNTRAALPYLDNLETDEQKQKFQHRVMQRTTPLTPEAAEAIIKQITAPNVEKGLSAKEKLELLNALDKQMTPLRRREQINALTDEEKYELRVLQSMRSNLFNQLNPQPQGGSQPDGRDTLSSVVPFVTMPAMAGRETPDSTPQWGRRRSGLTQAAPQSSAMATTAIPANQQAMELSEKEIQERLDSKPFLENVAQGIAGIGSGIAQGVGGFAKGVGNLAGAALDVGLDIGDVLGAEALYMLGQRSLPKEAEQEVFRLMRIIEDYNSGEITGDEMDKNIDGLLLQLRPMRRNLRISSTKALLARGAINKLPFDDAQINTLEALRAKDKFVQAFWRARDQLSDKRKNDIKDITVLVNREMAARAKNEGINYVALTPQDLRKELLQRINVYMNEQ